jgi:hypothetical protein
MRLFFMIGLISMFVARGCLSAPAPSVDVTLKETLDCSMIRIAEMFYILENCNRSPSNQKIRSWIIAKIEFQLEMMESIKLDDKKREFIQKARKRLLKQK